MENSKKNIFEVIKKLFIFVLYLLIFCASVFLAYFGGIILALYAPYEGALLSSHFFLFTMAVELILFALNYIYLDKIYKSRYKILISLFCTFFVFVSSYIYQYYYFIIHKYI